MDYHFIEYRSNEAIPGDWEWYLASYSIEPHTGRRDWLKEKRLAVRVYEFPPELKHHVLTAVAFTPMNAKKYSGKSLPAPEGVRWGDVTCIRKDFADLLGTALHQDTRVGELLDKAGRLSPDWVPIFIKNRISIPIGKPADPASTAKHITGNAIYESDRYSLILRDDIYQVVRGFQFRGCKIFKCAVPL